jgi:CRP/FNR family cyclic AMP-dependent transcriptional regulator
MDSNHLGEIMPLFAVATPETLEWLASVARIEEYSIESILVGEDDWGGAAFFIVSGWVKIRHRGGVQATTVEILGSGDCFGEMAIIEESLPCLTAIAVSDVLAIVIPAQRFLQLLLKDSPIQQKILQLTIKRTRKLYRRLQLYHYSPKTKLIKTLLILADYYGRSSNGRIALFNFPVADLADLAQIPREEAIVIVEKLITKGWLEIDSCQQTLYLNHPKQLAHLAK